jgi:cytoskeleton protein RodZ
MTEDTDQIMDSNSSEAPVIADPVVTAGALIRRAREASGLHIAALAVSLKVPVKKLEALEADRFELLPDAVFVRALAGSVCRTLKIDPTEILRILPSQSTLLPGHRVEHRRVVEAATISTSRPVFLGTVSRPAVIGGLLLVLGALALIWLPPLDFSTSKTESVDGDLVSTPPLPVMAVEPAPPDQVSEVPGIDLRTATVNSSAVVSAPVLSVTEGVQTGTPPTTGIVVFKPTADSWVEVTDAKGVVVLRRQLVAGEVAGATGALPLSVIVGRADVTPVQIRGQSFDLASVSRDNVARFEVK